MSIKLKSIKMSFRSDREVLGSDREVHFVTLSSNEMLKQMLVSNRATYN